MRHESRVTISVPFGDQKQQPKPLFIGKAVDNVGGGLHLKCNTLKTAQVFHKINYANSRCKPPLGMSASPSIGMSKACRRCPFAGWQSNVVMTTSALLRHGPGYIATLLEGLAAWLAAREFASLQPVRGIMSQHRLRDPQAFERANYIKILQGYRQS